MQNESGDRTAVAVRIERLADLVRKLDARMQEGPNDVERRLAVVVGYLEIFAADVSSEIRQCDSIQMQIDRLERALLKIENQIHLSENWDLLGTADSATRLDRAIRYLSELVSGTDLFSYVE